MNKETRSFKSLIDEILDAPETLEKEDADSLEIESFELADAQDLAIFMHRDTHFAGSFDIMLDYYRSEGMGVDPEIDIPRILILAELDQAHEGKLAELVLSETDKSQVQRARNTYEKLRDACEAHSGDQKRAKALAELILSEEEEPLKEMDAVVAEGEYIAATLVDLLESEDFASPYFPGYGRVPNLAAECLGRIGSPEAVPKLFEMLGHGDFELEERVLTALRLTGTIAKRFLLKIIQSEQITRDHETAAFALLHFAEDPQVAVCCLAELEKPEVRQQVAYATYLVLGCESLKNQDERTAFRRLAELPHIPLELQQEMQTVLGVWDNGF